MPQVVDFEALVCCGEGKVACETLADAPKPEEPPSRPPPQDDPDLPADSFRLPLADVLDWISRNAAAAPNDRDESIRGGAHPKSSSAAAHHHHKHSGGSGQLRYAKPKGLIIGLPNKIQSSGYLGQSARRHAAHSRFFPKKGGEGSVGSGRTAVTTLEPTSPKVSCFGRVLADQDQSRRRRASTTQVVSRESSSVSVSAAANPTGEITGLWGVLLGLSCCAQQRDAPLLGEEESASTSGASQAATSKGKTLVMAPPVPGLGGMTRLASGRRAASWGGNLELEQVLEHAAGSGPSPQRWSEQGILPGRRSVGSLAYLDGDRDWEGGGSASV
ncbi:hypothetical protein Taro_042773 [Colocasia esculenta]|uniref:Uncharacterized protein n=1 Tax=Colocasia esculenta TaxID=4460 RepID=A0A843WZ96_COLES|nr:hypothetical protein [Colocasia esculenta]